MSDVSERVLSEQSPAVSDVAAISKVVCSADTGSMTSNRIWCTLIQKCKTPVMSK